MWLRPPYRASDFVTELDCSGYILIDSQQEWQEALDSAWPREFIRPMSPVEWDQYVMQWEDPCNTIEGVPYFVPYPDTEFLPPELYVFEGDESSEDPNDAGLVMKWGDDTTPDGNYASAWHYDYGQDPDLSNCIITVTRHGPAVRSVGSDQSGIVQHCRYQRSAPKLVVAGGRTGQRGTDHLERAHNRDHRHDTDRRWCGYSGGDRLSQYRGV